MNLDERALQIACIVNDKEWTLDVPTDARCVVLVVEDGTPRLIPTDSYASFIL